MTEQVYKYGVWATIIAAIISGAVALYIHFDSKSLKVEQIPSKTESQDKKNGASVSIANIQLTPVAFDIPSSFYIEIENGFLTTAKDLNVLIDFGEAKIDKCSVKPNDLSNIETNRDPYVLKLKVKELLKNEHSTLTAWSLCQHSKKY